MNHLFPIQEARRGRFLLSTDPDLIDVTAVHDYLAHHSYWAQGVAREVVERAIAHSLCWGIYDTAGGYALVGFGRAITDFATFAYLSDVFVLPAHQGRGLGKWLVQTALAHPELQTLRKWNLDTRDAHTLYTRFGFKPNPNPQNALIFRPKENS